MRLGARLAVVTVAVATAAFLAGPALADPVNGQGQPVTPASYDVVGVGGGSTQFLLDQLSFNYDTTHQTHNKSHPYIYSWDSVAPGTGAINDQIKPKQGCAKITRPFNPNVGIRILYTSAECASFAPVDRSPVPVDPTGLSFVALAQDNVTYATQQVSNAPHNLTTQDLREIYTCAVTNWDQFKGGRNGKIMPVLPDSLGPLNSQTFFLNAIGVSTPGACVTEPGRLSENVGTSTVLENKDAIVPYSAADFLTQRYHSAPCGRKPSPDQARFGCNQSGTLRLNSINGTSPTTGSGTRTILNKPATLARNGYTDHFVATMYDVVRGTKSIPSALRGFFGTKGYFCSPAARQAIESYGFEPAQLKGFAACGSITAS
jgi:hypothetical protein